MSSKFEPAVVCSRVDPIEKFSSWQLNSPSRDEPIKVLGGKRPGGGGINVAVGLSNPIILSSMLLLRLVALFESRMPSDDSKALLILFDSFSIVIGGVVGVRIKSSVFVALDVSVSIMKGERRDDGVGSSRLAAEISETGAGEMLGDGM